MTSFHLGKKNNTEAQLVIIFPQSSQLPITEPGFETQTSGAPALSATWGPKLRKLSPGEAWAGASILLT